MSHKNLEQMKNKMRLKMLPEKTICLNMIVKNESANMPRLLNSVKSFIDFVSIVDTGSTDNTMEVISKWCQSNKIPYKLHQEPFKDFGYNRTYSLKKAKESFPQANYFLLSDADFVWKVNQPNFKKFLYAHKYLIAQKHKTLYYTNIRLLSAEINWSCIGVTHEFWQEDEVQTCKDKIQQFTINSIEIDDREDGGCKTDKYVRDKRLLLKGLEDDISEPLRIRYTFYLAQTLKCLTEYEESIIMYQKRVDMKGFYEEVYYSHYQIGMNYRCLVDITKDLINIKRKDDHELTEDNLLYLKNWSKGMSLEELQKQQEEYIELAKKSFINAVEYCPTRAESLYQCTKMLREYSYHKEAYQCAISGKKIKFPVNESLFLENEAYSWGFNYELTILCYYMQKFTEGLEICVTLLEQDIPDYVRKEIEKNIGYYI